MERTIKHYVYHVIETKETVTFEEKVEISLLKECLNYCYHRGAKHSSPMTSKLAGINSLRKQMGIIK